MTLLVDSNSHMLHRTGHIINQCPNGELVRDTHWVLHLWPGFESLFVPNQTFLSTWFKGGQLGMALGISAATSYIGYLLSFFVSPIAANRVIVAFSFWLETIITGVSVLAAVIIFILYQTSENSIHQK